VVAEMVAGLLSHSLALVADAGHNFTDAFGLGLAAVGNYFQSRRGDHRKTFGYQRAGVLAAFVNALTLVLLAVGVIWESYLRLRNPEPVHEVTMIWIAAVGLVLNLGIAKALGGHGDDMNIRAAWIHMMGDAASCVGIIVGAVIIQRTDWLAIDPIISILIAVMIVWTAWDIFKDSLNILLEGFPKGLELSRVSSAIRSVDGVIDVHDLHVWSLDAEAHALSCHVLIDDMPPSASDAILQCINRTMCHEFAIDHTTIQFEHSRCALADEQCSVVQHDHHHHHTH
jgi:cobalt-zinc-cadmium efflux system protein